MPTPTIEYRTEDKSDWGDGPWQSEPDKVQYTDEATGLPCLIKRGPSGALCGYVGVTEEHPWFKMDYAGEWDEEEACRDYDNAPDAKIDVHGGLTYSSLCQEGPEDETICHIPGPGEPDHVWWFGFDCAHAGDVSPAIRARNRRRYEETGDPLWQDLSDPVWPESYKDINYVKGQVASLARQLKEV